MAEARALWFDAYERATVRTEAVPQAQEGWCEIRTHFSAVSPGTERLVYMGNVPAHLFEEMRCPYMGGAFPFPVKYGYSLVGEISAGADAPGGRLVHVLHPHQDRCVVRVEDTFPLPPDVSPRCATLASNMETAVNALWDAQVLMGERALVVGFGGIGSLVARLLSFVPGVQVDVVDTAPAKLDVAADLGFRALCPDAVAPPYDLAFHVSATAAGLHTAVESVGFEGRVIELSWYGTRPVSLQLGGTFHSQRKRIVSSQVSNISPLQRSRWDNRRRKELVFTLLRRPEFDAHITHTVPFVDLPRVYARLAQAPTEGLAYLVDYRM